MSENNLILDLSVLNTNRYFIFGDLRGEYRKMIDILYEQNFSYKDTVITTGNIVDMENEQSLDCLYFIKNNKNTYSVKGKKEFTLLNLPKNELPVWLDVDDRKDIFEYLTELPVVIKVNDFLYVVNAGIDPSKKLENQDPSVFYNIKEYDKDSRFYQFENPDEKSWYEFEIFSKEKEKIEDKQEEQREELKEVIQEVLQDILEDTPKEEQKDALQEMPKEEIKDFLQERLQPEQDSTIEIKQEEKKITRLIKYCFGGYNVIDVEQPAGYFIGRDINNRNLKCLIIDKKQSDKPILLET